LADAILRIIDQSVDNEDFEFEEQEFLEFGKEKFDEEWTADDNFYEPGSLFDPDLGTAQVRFSGDYVDKDTVIEAVKYRTLKSGKIQKS
jgi:hypothetical protein